MSEPPPLTTHERVLRIVWGSQRHHPIDHLYSLFESQGIDGRAALKEVIDGGLLEWDENVAPPRDWYGSLRFTPTGYAVLLLIDMRNTLASQEAFARALAGK